MADEKIDWSKKTWADLDLFGVGVADPYLFKGAAPLDSRLVIKEYNYLEGLKVKDIAYPGMIVYVKDKQSHYTYTGTAWEPFSGDSAPDANADTKGIVKLSDAVNSDLGAASGVTAATPAAVKAAYDKANHTHPYLSNTTKYASSSTKGGAATNAVNVTTNIGSKAISSIFESNGTTVKNATNATNAESANKVANALTIKLNDSATNEGTDKFTYDGSTAKTVTIDDTIKLSAPFTLTRDFGYYTLDGAASKSIGTPGQSLHEFLQGAFAAEDRTIWASYSEPSFGITIRGEREGEIGSTVTPTAYWSNSAGTYQWGTMNGNTPDYNTKSTGITYDEGNISATSGALNSAITFSATSQTVAVTGSSTRNAVTRHPISNIGTDLYSDLEAKYKTTETNSNVTNSATFTGYRKMFMGATSSTETITGALIRSLFNGNSTTGFKAQALNNKVITAESTDTKIIWAIPSSFSVRSIKFEYEPNKNDWKTLTSAGITSPLTVIVAGAGSDTGENYTVYVCAPAAGGTFGGQGINTRITIS